MLQVRAVATRLDSHFFRYYLRLLTVSIRSDDPWRGWQGPRRRSSSTTTTTRPPMTPPQAAAAPPPEAAAAPLDHHQRQAPSRRKRDAFPARSAIIRLARPTRTVEATAGRLSWALTPCFLTPPSQSPPPSLPHPPLPRVPNGALTPSLPPMARPLENEDFWCDWCP